MSQYLRCLVAGLFTNVATRQPSTSGRGGRGCYRTVIGGRHVFYTKYFVLAWFSGLCCACLCSWFGRAFVSRFAVGVFAIKRGLGCRHRLAVGPLVCEACRPCADGWPLANRGTAETQRTSTQEGTLLCGVVPSIIPV